ncbi:MAG: hypothetical protein J0H80_11350, partial [Rhizobiales bacterium]|nr:hypothetical protein [Hyphomicrobiales bacterium]
MRVPLQHVGDLAPKVLIVDEHHLTLQEIELVAFEGQAGLDAGLDIRNDRANIAGEFRAHSLRLVVGDREFPADGERFSLQPFHLGGLHRGSETISPSVPTARIRGRPSARALETDHGGRRFIDRFRRLQALVGCAFCRFQLMKHEIELGGEIERRCALARRECLEGAGTIAIPLTDADGIRTVVAVAAVPGVRIEAGFLHQIADDASGQHRRHAPRDIVVHRRLHVARHVRAKGHGPIVPRRRRAHPLAIGAFGHVDLLLIRGIGEDFLAACGQKVEAGTGIACAGQLGGEPGDISGIHIDGAGLKAFLDLLCLVDDTLQDGLFLCLIAFDAGVRDAVIRSRI